MASRQAKQRRLQQLKENLAIRISLLDRQVQEYLSNINSYHASIKSSAQQLMVSSSQDPSDIQHHMDMMAKVDRKTQFFMNLNSSFFDLLDADTSEDDDDGGEAIARPQQQENISPQAHRADDNDVQPRQAPNEQVQADIQTMQPLPQPLNVHSIPFVPALCHHQVTQLSPQQQRAPAPAQLQRACPAPIPFLPSALCIGRQGVLPPTASVSTVPSSAAASSSYSLQPASGVALHLPQVQATSMSGLETRQCDQLQAASLPTVGHPVQQPQSTLLPEAEYPAVHPQSLAASLPNVGLSVQQTRAASVSYVGLTMHNSIQTQAANSVSDVYSLRSGSSIAAKSQAVTAPSTKMAASVLESKGSVVKQPIVSQYLEEKSEKHLECDFLPSDVGEAARQEMNSQVSSAVTETVEKPLEQDTLPLDMMMTVSVSYIENPSSFYIIKNQTTIEQLTRHICEYIQQPEDYLPSSSVRVGSLCLAKFTDSVYYRARVISVHRDKTVAVYFVDFGNSHITNDSELLVLPTTFRQLPALGIYCCLSGVTSSSKTGMWTEAAINQFQERVAGQSIMCKAKLHPHDQLSVPTLVELYQTTTVPTPTRGMTSFAKTSGCSGITNISIASILLHVKQAQPIDNQALLAKFTANKPPPLRCSSSNSSDSHPPSSQHCSAGQPMPDTAVSKKHLEFDSDPEDVLPADRLQDILRRVPKIPRNLLKKREHTLRGSQSGQSSSAAGGLPGHNAETEKTGNTEEEVLRKARAAIKTPNKEMAEAAKSRGDQTAAGSSQEENTDAELKSKGADKEHTDNLADLGENVELYKALMQATSASTADNFTVFKAMAATVHSPNNFYVHKVSAETGTHLKNMMADLNRTFERMPKATLRFRSKKFEAQPGVLCCAQFSKDSSYYRAVVLCTSLPDVKDKQVMVFYIDFGDKEWLPRSQVYPLPSEFHYISTQAIWCSLAFVKPTEPGTQNGAATWQPEALAEFSRLVGGSGEEGSVADKVLQVLTVDRLPVASDRMNAMQKQPLQVVLIDPQDENVCLNHDLIVHGFATAAIPSSEAEEGTDADGSAYRDDLDNPHLWNDMEKDAYSLRNTYSVDVDDAGVALTGVKARGRQTGVCRFYNRPSSCWEGDRCPYLHVEPGQLSDVSGNLKKVKVFDEDQTELLPLEDDVVSVEVSCVRSPSHFYITLPWGPLSIQEVANNSPRVMEFLSQETLESLNKAMSQFYKNKRLDSDYSVYAPGEAVAAKYRRSGEWLRAKVIDVDPDEEKVLVMFVDFGDVEWVRELDMRQLDDRFLHLPPQAVECCLSGVVPPPPHDAWFDESRQEFFNLVNGKTLVAHIKQRLWSGRLYVELYDTSEADRDLDIRTTLIHKGLAAVAIADNASSNSPTAQLPTASASEDRDRDGDRTCYVPG